ncbi:FAA hydrolase family protein [Nocardia panacis]|uniref:FAA hydrolase family protein n=1 Tax=Nocardia panacis TaxID=2340916 RepID=A0A3A4KJH8_9NOCA|nr:FAA hydrolase family protein [Nocardia panacis]
MKFVRLGAHGSERPGVIDESGTVFDLRSLTADIDGAFLAADPVAVTRRALAEGRLEKWSGAAELRIGAPIARPTAVICIGQNYAAHAAESGSAAPEQPIIFFKHPNTVVGPTDDVTIPHGATTVDWEVELGVVIGRRAKYLTSDAEALDHVAGYVVSHDVSERDWQTQHSGGQWSKGKTAEGFNPVGPWLVPAEAVDPQRLRLWSRVNGAGRQDSNTADQIFTVAQLVRHLSQYMVLEPGDLINTGTPEGVALSGRFPYLRGGDVVEMGIEGLGAQRQTFVPAP